MNLIECFRVSIRGLIGNKMRTLLTMLGIIIGVGVTILVVAIGKGAAVHIQQTVASLGTNRLAIWNGPPKMHIAPAAALASSASATSSNGVPAPPVAPNRLTLQQAEFIQQNFKQTVAGVSPIVGGNVQIRFGDTNATSNLQGCETTYDYVNNASIQKGSFFTQSDVNGDAMVCVIGRTVVGNLTGSRNSNMIGQYIDINRQQFKVVGILNPKGTGAWGQDQDDVILCPITTAMQRILHRNLTIDFMAVRCTTSAMIPLAVQQIADYLRVEHHLQPPFPQNDDFQIHSATEILHNQQSITGTMTTLLSIVAVISLVVGGIGIMNIMLVSVTERTREIGIRKAIGATPRDILMQFMIESSIISILGGIIGICIGVGGAYILANYGGWNVIVIPASIIAALCVSAGIGMFFGIYPASKAAALHPIEALRFE